MSNTIKTTFNKLNAIGNSSRTARDILLYCKISQTRCFIWNFFQVNEWMNEWVNEWLKEWIYEMDGWMDGWTQNWNYLFVSCGAKALLGSRQPPCSGFEITLGDTTSGRTLLDEWLAGRRDLYLRTHSTPKRHPCTRWDPNPQSQQASGRRPWGQRVQLRVHRPIRNVQWQTYATVKE
jgi:hypothetical protein